MFLIPIAISASSTQNPTAGQPLPPGTVKSSTIWNSTQACPTAVNSGEPLTTQSQWSTQLRIPAQLFMGATGSSSIAHSYLVSSNGTFSASDDSGNSFAIGPLAGLPQGTVTLTLKANSTKAFQDFLVKVGNTVVANVTAIYSVRHQFCQPAGLQMDIKGTANWGTKRTGSIQLSFKSKPVKLESYRAWLGNKSGTFIGFDWRDSAALSPTFSAASNTISWSVGSSFNIDPATIGTTTDSNGLMSSNQNHICVTNRRDWVFYFDGALYRFRSSTDGSTWSSATTISTSGTKADGGLGLVCSGNSVYTATSGASGGGWYYNSGTLNSDGTISWGTEINLRLGGQYGQYTFDNRGETTMVVDTSGRIWVSLYASGNYDQVVVWKCPSSCGTSSSWQPKVFVSGAMCDQLVALTAGKLALLYRPTKIGSVTQTCSTQTGGALSIQTYDGGTSWSSASTTPATEYYIGRSKAVAIGDTVELCTPDSNGGNHMVYLSFPYGGSWSSPVTLDAVSAGTNGMTCSLSTDGLSNLVATYTNDPNLDTVVSVNSGTAWGSEQTLSTGESGINWVTTQLSMNLVSLAAWMAGTSNPYNIRFGFFV
jgi:hypothetical protein